VVFPVTHQFALGSARQFEITREDIERIDGIAIVLAMRSVSIALASSFLAAASILIARITVKHRQSPPSLTDRPVDYAKHRAMRQFAFGPRGFVAGGGR